MLICRDEKRGESKERKYGLDCFQMKFHMGEDKGLISLAPSLPPLFRIPGSWSGCRRKKVRRIEEKEENDGGAWSQACWLVWMRSDEKITFSSTNLTTLSVHRKKKFLSGPVEPCGALWELYYPSIGVEGIWCFKHAFPLSPPPLPRWENDRIIRRYLVLGWQVTK